MLLARRKEECCAPSPDKIDINNWDSSQRADLSSLPLNPSWMEALCPFCFRGVSMVFCSTQPVFTRGLKAANSSQKFFLVLCFPSAVCFPLHTPDADGAPSHGDDHAVLDAVLRNSSSGTFFQCIPPPELSQSRKH